MSGSISYSQSASTTASSYSTTSSSSSGSSSVSSGSSSSTAPSSAEARKQLAKMIATKVPPLRSIADEVVNVLNGSTARKLLQVAKLIDSGSTLSFNTGSVIAAGTAAALGTTMQVTGIMCAFANSYRHWKAHKKSDEHFFRIYELAHDVSYEPCDSKLKDSVTYTYVQKMRKSDDAFFKAIPVAGTLHALPGMIRGFYKYVRDTRGEDRKTNAAVLIDFARHGTTKEKELATLVIEQLVGDERKRRRVVKKSKVDDLAEKLKCVN